MATLPLLLESGLRALAVAVVVWAGLRVFRVGNVVVQKAAWTMVLAAAVTMPLMMHWQGMPAFATLRVPLAYLGRGSEAVPKAASAAAPVADVGVSSLEARPSIARPILESTVGVGDRFPAPVISKSEYGASSAAPLRDSVSEPISNRKSIPPQPRASLMNWQSMVGIVYFAIVSILIFRMILGLFVALRLWLGAEPVLLDLAGGNLSRLHVRSTEAIASPVTICSAVLLPADYVEWDAEKLRIVLAHERSHIRQGDFYLQLVANIYAAVFWFSPLGWWLKGKLSNLGEAIGDHAALNHAASPASYAQLLLEFAALPRPTLIGVAMARPTTISQRIERLLNESTFSHAFGGSKGRALLAILIVPVAIFAATALVRVEAGSVAQTPAPSPSAPASPAVPAPPASPSSPDAAPTPGGMAAPVAEPPAPLTAPGADAAIGADSVLAPVPPEPPAIPNVLVRPDVHVSTDARVIPDGHVSSDLHIESDVHVNPDVYLQIDHQLIHKKVEEQIAAMKMLRDSRAFEIKGADGYHSGYSYGYSKDGESWAVVSGTGDKTHFSGNWNGASAEQVEKARKLAHGNFLWFTKSGKSYIVDDPATAAQIEAINAQMKFLGRKQEELGLRQAELGKLEGESGKQFELAKITAPDISKEMSGIIAAMTKLQAEMGKEINREELAEVQGKLAQLQGKLGALQGGFLVKDGDWGSKLGKLSAEQGELGARQGEIGAKQAELAREAERKVKAIIEESLKNGKAKQVE
jgi:beta-lactamase regulating signal transducer with metallopeptidase domain